MAPQQTPQQTCARHNQSLGDQDRTASHSSLSMTIGLNTHIAVMLPGERPEMRGAGKRFTAQTLRCGTRWLDFQGFILSTFSMDTRDTQLVSIAGSDATETSGHMAAPVMIW